MPAPLVWYTVTAPQGTKPSLLVNTLDPAVEGNTMHLFVVVGTIPVSVAPSRLIAMLAALAFWIRKNFLNLLAARSVTLVALATVGVVVTVFPADVVI